MEGREVAGEELHEATVRLKRDRSGPHVEENKRAGSARRSSEVGRQMEM